MTPSSPSPRAAVKQQARRRARRCYTIAVGLLTAALAAAFIGLLIVIAGGEGGKAVITAGLCLLVVGGGGLYLARHLAGDEARIDHAFDEAERTFTGTEDPRW